MTTELLLDRLCAEAPPLFDTAMERRRCLNATRHAVEVLTYFGVRARPVKTQAISGNRAWQEWIESGPDAPMPDTAWAVGIDLQKPGGYPGHLVAVADLDEGAAIVDLSLGQLSRPEHDMPLPEAAWFRLPVSPWMEPVEYRAAGTILIYRPLPEKDWMSASGWRHKPDFAGELIRKLRV